jgi:hypothetical protein
MVQRAVLVVLSVLAVSCTPPAPEGAADSGSVGPDPIVALVERLSADRSGEWVSGLYPRLDLPATATVKAVFDRMFQRSPFNEGNVSHYTIVEMRPVVIEGLRPEPYTAAIVDTNFGRRIVLFRRERLDWWTRIYEIAPSA